MGQGVFWVGIVDDEQLESMFQHVMELISQGSLTRGRRANRVESFIREAMQQMAGNAEQGREVRKMIDQVRTALQQSDS